MHPAVTTEIYKPSVKAFYLKCMLWNTLQEDIEGKVFFEFHVERNKK